MEVLTSNEVLPVMFQNKFVIVSGAGQIRIATYGFIGGPAVGDRPCVSIVIAVPSCGCSTVPDGTGSYTVSHRRCLDRRLPSVARAAAASPRHT